MQLLQQHMDEAPTPMTIDEQIAFYEREYKAAKTRAMALVAFGAYMALVKFKSGEVAT